MYINKAQRKVITGLLLTAKVAGKRAGALRTEGHSPEWHDQWDICEYAHMAVAAMLGDKVATEQLQEMAENNTIAQSMNDRRI